MESFPTFHDPAIFPAFSAIPLASQDSDVAKSTTSTDEDSKSYLHPPKRTFSNDISTLAPSYCLIGTISENMTLGTNPTFICKDRDTVPFAVTIKLRSASPAEAFDVKICKKGYTMTIRHAKKFGVKEGKQGFIETSPEKIKVKNHIIQAALWVVN